MAGSMSGASVNRVDRRNAASHGNKTDNDGGGQTGDDVVCGEQCGRRRIERDADCRSRARRRQPKIIDKLPYEPYARVRVRYSRRSRQTAKTKMCVTGGGTPNVNVRL